MTATRKCSRCRARPAAGKQAYCTQCRYEYDLWRWYRLSPTDYAELLAGQLGRCAVCAEPFGDQRPHVDHVHGCQHPDKGKSARNIEACCRECVRGLLCGPCNHLVGWMEKRSDLLAAALRYLGTEIADLELA